LIEKNETIGLNFRFRNRIINGGKEKEHVHQKKKIPKQIHWVLPMLVGYLLFFSVKNYEFILFDSLFSI
jgi:hypothetical protein